MGSLACCGSNPTQRTYLLAVGTRDDLFVWKMKVNALRRYIYKFSINWPGQFVDAINNLIALFLKKKERKKNTSGE
jgi:hypothetical protein